MYTLSTLTLTLSQVKTKMESLHIGVVITLALFVIGTVLAIPGLFTVFWMTHEVVRYDSMDYRTIFEFRVGLFRLCADGDERRYGDECFHYGDDPELFNPDNSAVKAWRVLIISGVALAFSSIVACVVFILVNIRRNSLTKGPFMATMVSSISSVICFVCGLIVFGVKIYVDGYSVGSSFSLTCFAAALIFIGCIIFPFIARSYGDRSGAKLFTDAEVQKITRTSLIGISISLALFAVGAGLVIPGLFTVFWMTHEVVPYDAYYGTPAFTFQVGLFRLCADGNERRYGDECFHYGDDPEFFNPDHSAVKSWRGFIINGLVLACCSIISSVAFILVNMRGKRLTKIPFVATVSSSISSVICLAFGLVVFGVKIYEDGFSLGYSFALTCVATAVLLPGCIVFPCTTHRYLQTLQRAKAEESLGKPKIGLDTKPEKVQFSNDYVLHLDVKMKPDVQICDEKLGLEKDF